MKPKSDIRIPNSEDSSFGIGHSSFPSPAPVRLRINGHSLTVARGTLLAAAIACAGVTSFRSSVLNQPRGPLCGMGICMECRVTIDGVPHCRSCLIECRDGMEVQTG